VTVEDIERQGGCCLGDVVATVEPAVATGAPVVTRLTLRGFAKRVAQSVTHK
jgi:hypothetical protein